MSNPNPAVFGRNVHVHGVDRGSQVTGVVVASLSLSWIATFLRFYTRLRLQRFFGREDWLTMASMVIFSVLCGLALRSLHFGLGIHKVNIDAYYRGILSKITYISELLYVATMAITKISIGFYFLRLAGRLYQVVIIYAVMLSVLCYSTAYFFFLVFQCHPVSCFWSQAEDLDDHCFQNNTLANATYLHAAFSALSDWILGILPITFVWNMKMNFRTKLSVILILSLGFFASSATLVRIVYIGRLENSSDYAWEGINLTKWSIVEPAIALTAAGIATLRPLFSKHLFSRKLDTYNVSSAESTPHKWSLNHVRTSEDSYSAEFAQMLGLRRHGLSTMIFADRVILSREGEHTWGMSEEQLKGQATKDSPWLKSGYKPPPGARQLEEGSRTTTTITTTIEH